LDYLLKPIDGKDLKAAVERAEQRHWTQTQQLNLLKQQLHEGDKKLPEKLHSLSKRCNIRRNKKCNLLRVG